MPDHVCLNTMTATIYYGDAPAGAELTPDIAWSVSYVGDPLDGRGCPVPGSASQADELSGKPLILA